MIFMNTFLPEMRQQLPSLNIEYIAHCWSKVQRHSDKPITTNSPTICDVKNIAQSLVSHWTHIIYPQQRNKYLSISRLFAAH